MHRRHFYHKRKLQIHSTNVLDRFRLLSAGTNQIVDESVHRFVAKHTPRQVRHTLQPIVDEQLRRHHHEPAHSPYNR